MAYLPPEFAHDTTFPHAFGQDVRTQIRLIEEQAKRAFPRIPYYMVRNTTGIATVDSVTGGPAPVGATGQQTYDPVWGEVVDPAMAGGPWTQPHRDGTISAGIEIERYQPPVEIHARVQREMKDYELKKYGFDEMRDLVLHVPASILDQNGITAQPGDKFFWNGEEFIVLVPKEAGYWKNSNIRLWVSIMCENKRRGA